MQLHHNTSVDVTIQSLITYEDKITERLCENIISFTFFEQALRVIQVHLGITGVRSVMEQIRLLCRLPTQRVESNLTTAYSAY